MCSYASRKSSTKSGKARGRHNFLINVNAMFEDWSLLNCVYKQTLHWPGLNFGTLTDAFPESLIKLSAWSVHVVNNGFTVFSRKIPNNYNQPHHSIWFYESHDSRAIVRRVVSWNNDKQEALSLTWTMALRQSNRPMCLLYMPSWRPSLIGHRPAGHNFKRGSSKDHCDQVW